LPASRASVMHSKPTPFDHDDTSKHCQRLLLKDQMCHCRRYSLCLGVCFVVSLVYGILHNEVLWLESANYRWTRIGQGDIQNRRGSTLQPPQTDLGWVGSLDKGRARNSSQGMQDGILATLAQKTDFMSNLVFNMSATTPMSA
jgi:hypothetical protein